MSLTATALAYPLHSLLQSHLLILPFSLLSLLSWCASAQWIDAAAIAPLKASGGGWCVCVCVCGGGWCVRVCVCVCGGEGCAEIKWVTWMILEKKIPHRTLLTVLTASAVSRWMMVAPLSGSHHPVGPTLTNCSLRSWWALWAKCGEQKTFHVSY